MKNKNQEEKCGCIGDTECKPCFNKYKKPYLKSIGKNLTYEEYIHDWRF